MKATRWVRVACWDGSPSVLFECFLPMGPHGAQGVMPHAHPDFCQPESLSARPLWRKLDLVPLGASFPQALRGAEHPEKPWKPMSICQGRNPWVLPGRAGVFPKTAERVPCGPLVQEMGRGHRLQTASSLEDACRSCTPLWPGLLLPKLQFSQIGGQADGFEAREGGKSLQFLQCGQLQKALFVQNEEFLPGIRTNDAPVFQIAQRLVQGNPVHAKQGGELLLGQGRIDVAASPLALQPCLGPLADEAADACRELACGELHGLIAEHAYLARHGAHGRIDDGRVFGKDAAVDGLAVKAVEDAVAGRHDGAHAGQDIEKGRLACQHAFVQPEEDLFPAVNERAYHSDLALVYEMQAVRHVSGSHNGAALGEMESGPKVIEFAPLLGESCQVIGFVEQGIPLLGCLAVPFFPGRGVVVCFRSQGAGRVFLHGDIHLVDKGICGRVRALFLEDSAFAAEFWPGKWMRAVLIWKGVSLCRNECQS